MGGGEGHGQGCPLLGTQHPLVARSGALGWGCVHPEERCLFLVSTGSCWAASGPGGGAGGECYPAGLRGPGFALACTPGAWSPQCGEALEWGLSAGHTWWGSGSAFPGRPEPGVEAACSSFYGGKCPRGGASWGVRRLKG